MKISPPFCVLCGLCGCFNCAKILDHYRETVSAVIRGHDHVPSRISVGEQPQNLRIQTLSVAMGSEAYRCMREAKKDTKLFDAGIIFPISKDWKVDMKLYRTEVDRLMETSVFWTHPLLHIADDAPTSGSAV